ncbi:GFA family protein [Sphingomonas vulcanisoli]|uniref:GFA family protein n=1 Tax=Sphingomonas vulcanisoli TaxID=1658060 RepID=UPI001423DD68
MNAECQCGQLSVVCSDTVPAPGPVVCHCVACQRRTGSPFGVVAYYSADQIVATGEAKRFARSTDEGNRFEAYFCPNCGSTVYVKSGKHPTKIGIPIGAIADPSFPTPVRSVWEQTMHAWVTMPGDVQHYPRGRGKP